MTTPAEQATARRALALLDLTDLGDACSASAVDDLCRKARETKVAAICVWPHFVGQAARVLAKSGIGLATVVNFPAGGEDVDRAVEDAMGSLDDGADEIDLVLPYAAVLRGETALASDMVGAVREVCGGRLLKVILETGEMPMPGAIAAASRLAIAAGADFLKTSTGKTPVSATPAAAETMLAAIRDHGGRVGLKVSGGLRTIADAALYLDLADRVMGPDWASPKTFRIGASALHADLVAALRPPA